MFSTDRLSDILKIVQKHMTVKHISVVYLSQKWLGQMRMRVDDLILYLKFKLFNQKTQFVLHTNETFHNITAILSSA